MCNLIFFYILFSLQLCWKNKLRRDLQNAITLYARCLHDLSKPGCGPHVENFVRGSVERDAKVSVGRSGIQED